MVRRLRPLALVLLCSLGIAAHAQAPYVPIEQRLSGEQLRATGLDQLSAEQLRLLNSLLGEEHAAQAAQLAPDRVDGSDRARRGGFLRGEREAIVSRIVGDFQGWSGGTRFVLANGQTWRVIDTPEFYVPKSKAVSGPAVAITPGVIGGWYLQVEGQSVRAKVQQVN